MYFFSYRSPSNYTHTVVRHSVGYPWEEVLSLGVGYYGCFHASYQHRVNVLCVPLHHWWGELEAEAAEQNAGS